MPVTGLPASGLLGRETERKHLDQLVADVCDGQSRVLVVRGAAGIGKSVLLDYVAERAAGAMVARASGVESEMELPFAGLQAVCAPVLGDIGDLPEPQRLALMTAFGLDRGPPPDRFMVGLAVLGLLAGAAERRPLLCIVDDAQWLDRVSAHTLAFVGRRLLAEGVGLIFGLRDDIDDGGIDDDALEGLPELVIEGLGPLEARALLDRAIPGPLDDQVRKRILAEASGNPLGLIELPRGLTPMTVAGGFGLPQMAPLTSRLEHGFARELAALPSPPRTLLLLAAAEPSGDVALLRRAGELLSLGPDAFEAAEDTGLVRIDGQVRFRHPLVRSATYRIARVSERRHIHRALAEATDPNLEPDRRAWHRAQAAAQFDEEVAGELERSADRARQRGGLAAAAAFLARAAELSPDPARSGERALAAAKARFESGALEAARELIALAEMCPLNALQRARLARLRAQTVFALTRGSDAPPLFLAAARQLEAVDPAAARETYLEALETALIAGRVESRSVVRLAAEAARGAPVTDEAPRSSDLLLDGMATRFTSGPKAGAPTLRLAVQAFANEPLDTPADVMSWLSRCQAVMSTAVFELWDDEAFLSLPTRATQVAREAGALTVLPVALAYLAGVEMFSGDFAASSAAIQESDAIRTATGHVVVGGLGLIAWRARHDALKRIDAAYTNAITRGEGRVVAMAGCCTAILHNGLARYEVAYEGALRGSEDDDQWYVGWSLAELVEAATRSGRPQAASSALSRLQERAEAAGTDWALGVLARSRALLSEGAQADVLYREAIERLNRPCTQIEAFRAHLLYGEWLRREQRRRLARDHLRAAHEAFARIGAEAFAERARRELALTGENVPRRTADSRDVLTAQESQIARMARDGESNPEIGAQLFISPRTVEYHLKKVSTKLGIRSRKELRAALAAGDPVGD